MTITKQYLQTEYKENGETIIIHAINKKKTVNSKSTIVTKVRRTTLSLQYKRYAKYNC